MTTNTNNMAKFMVLGAIFGGIFGSIGGYFLSNLIIGGIFGVIFGWIVGRIVKFPQNQEIKADCKSPQLNLQLKEEELEIIKSRSKTGEVKFYKEIIEEEKTVTIPLEHEELVIETFEFDGDKKKSKDVIRVRLTNEEVVVTKHPVKVAEVSIFKNQVTETKQVKETLKKEQVVYEVIGLADVKNIDLLKEEQRIH